MLLLPFIRLMTACHAGLVATRRTDERGQSMAEYALLILGVGLLAAFVFKWLQGSGMMENLFSSVISKILPG